MGYVLGYALIVLGVALIFVALAGAVRAVFGTKLSARTSEPEPAPRVSNVAEAMRVLIQGLLATPLWLVVAIIGVVLIFVGTNVVARAAVVNVVIDRL